MTRPLPTNLVRAATEEGRAGWLEIRPLEVICHQWAAEFEARAGSGECVLDPGLCRAGAALLRTLPRTAPRSPHRLARRLAGLLDLDAERLVLWLFARCVVDAADWPDLAGVARRLAPP